MPQEKDKIVLGTEKTDRLQLLFSLFFMARVGELFVDALLPWKLFDTSLSLLGQLCTVVYHYRNP